MVMCPKTFVHSVLEIWSIALSYDDYSFKKAKSHKKSNIAASTQLLTALFSSSTLSGIGRPAGMPGEDDRCLLFWCLMLKEQMTTDRPDELLYIIMLSSSLPRYSRLPANAVYMSVGAQGESSGTTYI